MDRLEIRRKLTEEEEQRQMKAKEASRLMVLLGLMIDKKRTMEKWLFRLRRSSDMFPVWQKRGKSQDSLTTEMIRWMKKQLKQKDV